MTNTSLSPVSRNTGSLNLQLTSFRAKGEKIAFVPTMGALHDGHLSLIKLAKSHAQRVVLSVFVNPKQFAPNEDFDAYPRPEGDDIAKASAAGVDLIYIPNTDEMYPEGYQTKVLVPQLADCLDGTSRPGFFDGIATVVTKLFNQVRPDAAIFGEKDFQQLLIIRQMTQDLNMPVEVIGAPILREDDGLALSSRNRYLSEAERQTAGQLNQVMQASLAALRDGTPTEQALSRAKQMLEMIGLAPIDYFELRQTPDLRLATVGPLNKADFASTRLFAAVMLGKTRLIDNMAVAR